jgi:hypothetical protein
VAAASGLTPHFAARKFNEVPHFQRDFFGLMGTIYL